MGKFSLKNNFTKEKLAIFISVLGFIFLTFGFTAAFFSYIGHGTGENAVSSDSITFLYEEIDKQGNGISITNAMPVSDDAGQSGQAFNFQITAKTADKITIPYEIAVSKRPGSDNLDDIVKLYLTKVDSTGNEEEVALNTYDDFTTVEYYNKVQKRIYQETVPRNSSQYIQKYRLRMWIDEDADFSDGTLNNKTFAISVNVYSRGQLVATNNRLSTMILADNVVKTGDPIQLRKAAAEAQSSSSSGGSYGGGYGGGGESSAEPVDEISGLYVTDNTDSGQDVYYFSGNVTNNYVKFAGKMWRAVSVNEDMSTKLVLDEPAEDQYYSLSTSSRALDNWYNANIGLSSSYSNWITDGEYCEAFSLRADDAYDDSNANSQETTSLSSYDEVTFKCVKDSSNVGLLSANEVLNAGNGVLGAGSSWLTTEAGYDSSNGNLMWYYDSYGSLNNIENTSKYVKLKPVITLKTETTATKDENGVYIVDGTNPASGYIPEGVDDPSTLGIFDTDAGVFSEEGNCVALSVPSMSEMCPGCKFFSLEAANQRWGFSSSSELSAYRQTDWATFDTNDIITMPHNAYKSTWQEVVQASGKNFFYGAILDNSYHITRIFSCAVMNGYPFCLEVQKNDFSYIAAGMNSMDEKTTYCVTPWLRILQSKELFNCSCGPVKANDGFIYYRCDNEDFYLTMDYDSVTMGQNVKFTLNNKEITGKNYCSTSAYFNELSCCDVDEPYGVGIGLTSISGEHGFCGAVNDSECTQLTNGTTSCEKTHSVPANPYNPTTPFATSYYDYGDPTSSSNTNPASLNKKVFVKSQNDEKSICVVLGDNPYCIPINSSSRRTIMKRIFSYDGCETSGASNQMYCSSQEYGISCSDAGYLYCTDWNSNDKCYLYSNGNVSCN